MVVASSRPRGPSLPQSSHRLSRKGRAVERTCFLSRSCLAVCLAIAVPAMSEETESPVPVYTNEDLDRVRPLRDQTGVASKPGTETEPYARAGTPRQRLGGDGASAGRKRRSAESDEE